MNTCPNCGTQNVEGVRFCVQCGTQLAPPAGSWRGDEAGGGNSAPFGTPQSQQQPTTGANAYVPPYAPPPPSFSVPPPPEYGAPLPAMSYATHGAGGFRAPMEYATWGQRVLGALVDSGAALGVGLLLYLVLVLPAILLGGIGNDPGPGNVVFPLFGMGLFGLAYFGFYIFNEVYLRAKRGATIGQGVVGLKTVTASGELPSMITSVLRLVVKLGLGAIPCLGIVLSIVDYLFPLWDEKKQTIHDKAVSTFVIKT